MTTVINKIIEKSAYELLKLNSALTKGMQNDPVGKMGSILKKLESHGLLCKTILDVGANKGKWSKLAMKYYPNAIYCMIEPLKEMIPYLERVCKRSPGSIFKIAAAGAKKGKLKLTYWDDMAGATLLVTDELISGGNQRVVEIIRIDDFLESNNMATPDLIKLDVQGYELEALKGATSTFGITEIYIIEVALFAFELHNNQPIFCDVVNFMNDRGYAVYDFAGFMRRPYDGALGQCDICFVKKDGFLRSSNVW